MEIQQAGIQIVKLGIKVEPTSSVCWRHAEPLVYRLAGVHKLSWVKSLLT